MDVLPEEQEKAKDIAVWHQALVLPQALATPIGGLVLDLFERVNCQVIKCEECRVFEPLPDLHLTKK